MLVAIENFSDWRVQTQSGKFLGALAGIDLDIETHQIKKYRAVQKNFLRDNLELLIDPAQIVSIKENLIVVNDAISIAQAEQSTGVKNMIATADSILTSETKIG